jgi:hypothetical protein
MSGMKTGEIDYLKNLGSQGSKDAFRQALFGCDSRQESRRFGRRPGNLGDGAICMLQK